jgi:NAD(P)-dependent dehydrogenase (short-subunit alcohol dehydrogenase family)
VALLSGKVAIVTGAGRGIGYAIAQRFAAEGASVLGTQRTAAEGEAAFHRLRAAGGDAMFVAADARVPDEVARVIDTAVARHGRLDVLVNNAGVGLLRTVVETTDEEYERVFDTNVRSVFLFCRYAIPHLQAAGGGAVINVGSVASFVGFAMDAAYVASKGAVLALTRQMALDYATSGVRVNAISPGFIETEMMRTFIDSHADPASVEAGIVGLHPLGRIGRADEVAAAALFLASDEASFITGESIAVDGGLLAR